MIQTSGQFKNKIVLDQKSKEILLKILRQPAVPLFKKNIKNILTKNE